MKSASNVKGINRITVIINNMRMDVPSTFGAAKGSAERVLQT
jgi:hypothetical protein